MERRTEPTKYRFARSLILGGLLYFVSWWCRAGTAASKPELESLSCKLPTQLDDLFFYAEAEIGGESSLNLVLDTGASFSAISTDLARRLKIHDALRDPPDRFGGTASRERQKMDFVEISGVKLGRLHLATENRWPPSDVSKRYSIFAGLPWLFLLPKGEGQVEGERGNQTIQIPPPCQSRRTPGVLPPSRRLPHETLILLEPSPARD